MRGGPWLLALLLGAGAGLARAQSQEESRLPAEVRLALPDCRPRALPLRALTELLHAELRADGVLHVRPHTPETPPSPRQGALLGLDMDCGPRVREATLWVENLETGERSGRTMDLRRLPRSARPRVLALGLAELLRATWPSLERAEPPPAPVTSAEARPSPAAPRPLPPRHPSAEPVRELAPPAPAPVPGEAPEARPAPTAPEQGLMLRAQGRAQQFFQLGDGLWGGELVGEYGAWSLGARLLTGQRSLGAARVDLRLQAASLGFTPLRLGSRALRLRAGARGTAGLAWAQGQPFKSPLASSGPQSVLHMEATLLTRLRVHLSRSWAGVLEVEGGHAWGLIATQDGRPVASLAGWTAGVSVGVGFSP